MRPLGAAISTSRTWPRLLPSKTSSQARHCLKSQVRRCSVGRNMAIWTSITCSRHLITRRPSKIASTWDKALSLRATQHCSIMPWICSCHLNRVESHRLDIQEAALQQQLIASDTNQCLKTITGPLMASSRWRPTRSLPTRKWANYPRAIISTDHRHRRTQRCSAMV